MQLKEEELMGVFFGLRGINEDKNTITNPIKSMYTNVS